MHNRTSSKSSLLPGPSYLESTPHWAWHDRLVSPRWKPAADGNDGLSQTARSAIMMERMPTLALGLLTMSDQVEKRKLARQTMFARYRALLQQRVVVLRYLLAAAQGGDAVEEERLADLENATHGDMLRLETPEGATRCWRKVVEWMRYALRRWPDAVYVGIADDDVYLSLSRLAYDLVSIRAQGHRRVYWGQPMWMAYWNDSRFEGEGFGGTSISSDVQALESYTMRSRQWMAQRATTAGAGRRAVRGRKRAGSTSSSPSGKSIGGLLMENMSKSAASRVASIAPILGVRRAGTATCATYSSSGEWVGRQMASSPFMFANTDLAILGADLARKILGGRCLANFQASFAKAEQTGRFRRRLQYPCEPNIDQLLGWLVAHAGRNVTYVEAQFHTHAFPWMTFANNPPTRHALYIHKIVASKWWWHYTDTLFAKHPTHLPLQRECRPCYDPDGLGSGGEARTSWVGLDNPSGALYSKWTCCATLPRKGAASDNLARCASERAHAPIEHVTYRGHKLQILDGYCEATDDADPRQIGDASCTRVHDPAAKGFWKYHVTDPISLTDCIKRCAACTACRYVSFSESHFQRECSWYATCPKVDAREELNQIGSELCPTFSTVRVRPPLASPTRDASI